MASAIPFFGPNSGDKPWVDQISKTLQTQISVTTNTPPVSIFEIPKTRKSEKLEAYVPQRIGLGPNHHFQPELYQKMEQHKINAIKRVFKNHQVHDIQHVVKRIRDLVPIMRASYDLYLDSDDDFLAWLFTIDGFFLIDQLSSYSDHQVELEAKDLIMLENQIPLMALKEILTVLWGETESDNLQEDFLESKIRFFCESHSPFLLSKEKIDSSQVHHLIDYMYQFIINNEASIPRKVNLTESKIDDSQKDFKIELIKAVIKIAGLIPIAQPLIEFLKQKFPGSTDGEAMVEEIKIPSVSDLKKHAGVKFRLSPENGGIRNIKFFLEKDPSVYLPLINLNLDSEIVLRNLVVYEQLMAMNRFTDGYGLELTEYVDFMCGIIDTSKDVKLLREEKIIIGDLEDEEIVKLFNGISRARSKMNPESELWKMVARLNGFYESRPIVWAQKLAQKLLLASVKVLTFVGVVLSILFMYREAYNNAYVLMVIGVLRKKMSLVVAKIHAIKFPFY